MRVEREGDQIAYSKNFRRVLLAAAIVSFLVIVMGGVVRAFGPENSCPDFPACYGSWLPPRQIGPLVDYGHRLATAILVPLLLAALVMAWRNPARDRWVKGSVLIANLVVLAQVILGLWVWGLAPSARPPLTALHLGLSLVVMASIQTAAVMVYYRQRGKIAAPGFHSPFALFTLVTAGLVFALLASGAVVSGSESGPACPSWPLCGGSLVPSSPAGWIALSHRFLVGLTAIFVGVGFVQAWRTQRSQTPVLVPATATAVLFFAQALLGGVKVSQGFPAYLVGLHEATSVAVWGAVIVQVAATGMARRTAEAERLEAATGFWGQGGWRRKALDFLLLTKPIVVALLLVTTFAGMVIGAKAWPSLALVFWTLLGGAMASGGSGAINQYIDRADDFKMQRTQKRPVPAGRMQPGEALAFGVGIAIASFYLLVVFVNLLAALLSLAGIIYYVLIYSIFLKKTTTQNIVIGGGAGAIPPLVGWAAATGSLSFPSLFLFAVVFMWTPPHFWALAIVRAKDYARAGVPMLPVIEGEEKARSQIMIYTVELVALTLLLPVFGLGGSLYLVLAAALGFMLLYSAYSLWKQGGNKTAWKMYRHSSMYLAFLFLALMVDRLVF